MAFLREYTRGKNKYYSIVENQRIGNKVRQKELQYIGSLAELKKYTAKNFIGTITPTDTTDSLDDMTFAAYSHGAGMALFWAAEEIGLEKIFDEVFPPKTIHGIPRSRILLLALIHRAVDPGSKRAFEGWVQTTSLPYHLRFNPKDLDSQAFWEAMDGITVEQIDEAWSQLVQRIMEKFDVKLGVLPLDYSNYFTFIDSRNGRCIICKRGHNKQKRDDLRQFSIAATTTHDLQIPIFWTLYEGNKNDKSEFREFTEFVKKKLKEFGIDPDEITLCFDGGSNSEESFKGLGLHLICAHSLVSHPELLDVGFEKYEEYTLENGRKCLAYRVKSLNFSGIEGTGILTHSKALEMGQLAELEKQIEKAAGVIEDARSKIGNSRAKYLRELKKRKKAVESAQHAAELFNLKLEQEQKEQQRKGRKKEPKAIPVWDPVAEMQEIVANAVYAGRKALREFTKVGVQQAPDDSFTITWDIDEAAKQAYCTKYFGKKLTCTDRVEWTTLQILQEYCNQECIENGIFKISKNVKHFSVRPQFHWTDDKIWVHTSLCMDAIALAEVLRLLLKQEGIEITRPALMDSLAKVNDGWLIRGVKEVKRVMARIDDEQAENIWNTVCKIYSKI